MKMCKIKISFLFLLVFCLNLNVYPEQPEADEQINFVVLVAGRNAVKWHKKNLDSLFNQTYDNYDVIYIDDESSDGILSKVKQYILAKGFVFFDTYNGVENRDIEIYKNAKGKKVILVRNTKRFYKLASQYFVTHCFCKDSDIIVELDADDWFANKNVLSYLHSVYADKNIWLTYGQFKLHGRVGKRNKEVPQHIAENNQFRAFGYHYTALRAYYAGLFKRIKKEDLMSQDDEITEFNGQFVPVTEDQTIMFPMIEMASKGHFKFIREVLYIYNYNRPRLSQKLQEAHRRMAKLGRNISQRVLKMKPYEPLESLNFEL